MVISGLSRGFGTCCLRFTNGVATTHARLASGWLARLYREGGEPSGSQWRGSDHIIILPPWTFPGATSENLTKSGCKRHSEPFTQAAVSDIANPLLRQPGLAQ